MEPWEKEAQEVRSLKGRHKPLIPGDFTAPAESRDYFTLAGFGSGGMGMTQGFAPLVPRSTVPWAGGFLPFRDSEGHLIIAPDPTPICFRK